MKKTFYASDRYGIGHEGENPEDVAARAYKAKAPAGSARKNRRDVWLCERRYTESGSPYIYPLCWVFVGDDGRVYRR